MRNLFAIGALIVIAACGGRGPSSVVPNAAHSARIKPLSSAVPITHVVFIVQENRTVDNLFNGFPGANTQSYGYAGNKKVNLTSRSLVTSWDIGHAHSDWKAAYAGGAMNGFGNESCAGKCPSNMAYSYVAESYVKPYWTMAQQYTLADEALQTNQGPSFPAHQYLLSATSALGSCINGDCKLEFSENGSAGCDSSKGARTTLIDEYGNEKQSAFPCRNGTSLIEEALNSGLTARYYQNAAGQGLWNGPDALKDLCPVTPCNTNPWFSANVITTPSQVITDVQNGTFANLTWVTPTTTASDHAGSTDGSGPSWVASVVNAIGESSYWNSTAIFVTWDDWGGFYDHVAPVATPTSDRYGFRVPVIIISPYSANGYVSHVVRHVYGSMAKFAEERLGLPSMGASDADTYADDFLDCFNFNQSPTPFVPIQGSMPIKHWKMAERRDAGRKLDY